MILYSVPILWMNHANDIATVLFNKYCFIVSTVCFIKGVILMHWLKIIGHEILIKYAQNECKQFVQ